MKPTYESHWAECHLEPDINEPEDALDLVLEALDGDLEFFSLPLAAE